MYIILNAEEAQTVSAPVKPEHILLPIKIKTEEYVLPVSVLQDTNHQHFWNFLLEKPQRAISNEEWYTHDE